MRVCRDLIKKKNFFSFNFLSFFIYKIKKWPGAVERIKYVFKKGRLALGILRIDLTLLEIQESKVIVILNKMIE
jgi:hypothetical protein